ncbi:MAG: hypothetical protein ACOYJQ_05710 [Pseudochelatococcus sp.]|jgi:hypothetical protein
MPERFWFERKRSGFCLWLKNAFSFAQSPHGLRVSQLFDSIRTRKTAGA